MVERWNPYEIQLSCFMVLAVLSEIRECDALNPEGLALLEFRERIENDPYGAFANWNSNHCEPCLWLGVQCVNGKVQMLDLSGFSLQGTLAPALRKLRYMRSLVLSNNCLSGPIPKEFGELKLLELLDLSHNNLCGTVPIEIGGMPSLKCISSHLLQGQKITFKRLEAVQSPLDSVWWRVLNQLKNYFGIKSLLRTKYGKCRFYADGNNCCHIVQSSAEGNVRCRLLGESSNLVAAPVLAPGNAAKLPNRAHLLSLAVVPFLLS